LEARVAKEKKVTGRGTRLPSIIMVIQKLLR